MTTTLETDGVITIPQERIEIREERMKEIVGELPQDKIDPCR